MEISIRSFVLWAEHNISGGREIRTLAPAEPAYRFSKPAPSATWVSLQAQQQNYIMTGFRTQAKADTPLLRCGRSTPDLLGAGPRSENRLDQSTLLALQLADFNRFALRRFHAFGAIGMASKPL